MPKTEENGPRMLARALFDAAIVDEKIDESTRFHPKPGYLEELRKLVDEVFGDMLVLRRYIYLRYGISEPTSDLSSLSTTARVMNLSVDKAEKVHGRALDLLTYSRQCRFRPTTLRFIRTWLSAK